ncbi:hypothetical protein [Bradyrhizobium sp. HKCCYLR20261]|uniref:hypothetical protein n=1 Tax=Bradyrhizobium sp. HKCCYLR20261 TaxID=3420760 RepID=UPI003EBC7846
MKQQLKALVGRTFNALGYSVVRSETLAGLQRRSQDASRGNTQANSSPANGSNSSIIDAEQERAKRGRRQAALWRVIEQETQADYYFAMDVVGSCTLRCPSCPVGNSPSQLPKGIMSMQMYRDILDKIKREHPGERVYIDLFNWGESALHKSLPDMIRLARENGIGIGLSTNLNSFPNMREIIRAKPGYIRISLSGYTNAVYQQTHAGGDINLVKSNMYLLRHHMDETGISVPIQVGFHVYRTNFPDDFAAVRRLCDELDFYFMPSIATFMPLEKAIHAGDGTLNDADKALFAKLVVPMEERSRMLGEIRPKNFDCEFRVRRTALNYDGSVALCCATFNNEQLIAKNYLEVSRDELFDRKQKHSFCTVCMDKNLDMVFTGTGNDLVEKRAASVLGKEFADFLDDRSTPWD